MRVPAIAVWLALAAPCLLAAGWLRLTSPNFELYTDTGEKSGRQMLLRLEQIHQAFRDIGGDRRESPLPVRVYLFAAEPEFRIYQPSKPVKGFFQSGPDRNYIVILSGDESHRVAFHEYIHLVLNHTSARLPKWFEEGLAEFYSTIDPAADKLIIGKPVPTHVRTLMQADWLDAARLANADVRSPVYNDHERAGVFYAQSWALVHMLNLSPPYRNRLGEYAALIADAEPAGQAFAKAFGKSLDAAVDDLRLYVRSTRWPQVQLAWEQPEPVSVGVHQLTDAALDIARTDLQLQLGLWDVSEATLRKLAAREGSTVDVETARGMVAMSRRDFEEARGHFEKAIQLGSTKAATHFEYAMLLRETGAAPDLVAGYLRKTVELNPNHAEAHFLLGIMASSEGQPEKAIEPLRKATAVLPRQANFWHALSLAYNETGRKELARRAANRALEAALTEQEVEMAKAAVRLADAAPAQPQISHRPSVTTPGSWRNKEGDSRVQGTLERIDCLGPAARFHVRNGAQTLVLHVTSPGEVLLKNASSLTFEFSCGKQNSRQVAVEYKTQPDQSTGTIGEITSVEFQ